MAIAFEGIPERLGIAATVDWTPLLVASLTRWSQGSWTVYMVAGCPQSECPKEARWMLPGLF